MEKAKWVIGIAVLLCCQSGLWASFDGDQYNDLFLINAIPGDDPVIPNGQTWWYEFDPANPLSPSKAQLLPGGDEGTFLTEPFVAIEVGNFDGDKYQDVLVVSVANIRWYEAYADDTATLVATLPINKPATDMKLLNLTAFRGSLYIAAGSVDVGSDIYRVDVIGDNQWQLTTLTTFSNRVITNITPCDFDDDDAVEIVAGWYNIADPTTGATYLYEETPEEAELITFVRALNEGQYGGDASIAGYFDNDAHMDVFINIGDGTKQLLWYESDGTDNGLFGFTGNKIASSRTNRLELVDFDRDGQMDLLTSALSTRRTQWFEASGDNTFVFVTEFSSQFYSKVLTTGDWDGNGMIDMFQGCGMNSSGNTSAINLEESQADNSFVFKVAPWSSQRSSVEGELSNGPLTCGDPGTAYLPGDIDSNCVVNLADLLTVISNWLVTDDLNDFSDVSEFWMLDTHPAY